MPKRLLVDDSQSPNTLPCDLRYCVFAGVWSSAGEIAAAHVLTVRTIEEDEKSGAETMSRMRDKTIARFSPFCMKENIDGLPVHWMESTDGDSNSYRGGKVATDLVAIMEGK